MPLALLNHRDHSLHSLALSTLSLDFSLACISPPISLTALLTSSLHPCLLLIQRLDNLMQQPHLPSTFLPHHNANPYISSSTSLNATSRERAGPVLHVLPERVLSANRCGKSPTPDSLRYSCPHCLYSTLLYIINRTSSLRVIVLPKKPSTHSLTHSLTHFLPFPLSTASFTPL